MSQLNNEIEDLLFELRVSPAVLTLAVLLKACEHRLFHEAGRFLDLPESLSLDYYATAGLRYLPAEHRAILYPVAQDLRATPEQVASGILAWFLSQRIYLAGMDVWIDDALRLTGDERRVWEFRCQHCRKIVPQTKRTQKFCSNACQNPPPEPVLDTFGF